ncbi:Uncharacterized protein dnl_29160 [Desulfonema limicola]|uniref:Uncharacterized protein n=1 Tax=Desulfonema limicola TaxID=45656 RepID=A0A975GGR2_9BACT|nr:hypothetical protein [Desulfonema limicola]QTA80606.1 Uncharacterized protein dnl_29160 [Desulfonema limicola]
MRKKAEKKIRQAVENLESKHKHRLDKVRAGAGLFPKVFDKTILDMERVGTIELYTEGIEELSDAEISSLVRRGNIIYVSFAFIENSNIENQTPETIVLILQGLYPGEWEKFEELCEQREGKTAVQTLEHMVRIYNNQG